MGSERFERTAMKVARFVLGRGEMSNHFPLFDNYLTDNEKGMQQLITWFLNDVMNEEVAHLANAAALPFADKHSINKFHRYFGTSI
jgi:hypothetical protein